MAEHFSHAHPSLIVRLNFCLALYLHMVLLVQLLLLQLLKDKAGNVNDIDNYRAITIVPVISKLLEGVVLKICEDFLVTDQLQFGFKEITGCADALCALKTTLTILFLMVVRYLQPP